MAGELSTINLKILSPSSEIEGGIRLQDLPISTTVRELRLKIQDAVPSKPAPERMRLIFRGKVVANAADSLETVFGAENIRESKDQSLHLVLRELPQPSSTFSTPAPRTAAAPPNPFRPGQAPPPASPPLRTNPFRTIPQPRSNSLPQVEPQPHHQYHARHPHVNHQQHVQQPLNNLGPIGVIPLPPQMQQQIVQALGQRGSPIPGAAPETATQPADGAAPAPAEGAPAPPLGILPPGFAGMPTPNGRTVRQEGIGPNGARWSVIYNDFTANIPLRPGQPTLPRPVPQLAAFAGPSRPFGSSAPGGVNVPLSWLLPRLRGTLQETAREVDNVRTLLGPLTAQDTSSQTQSTSSSTVWPSWRVEHIREHLRTITYNLNMVESGLSDPAMQLNIDVIALRQTASEVRRQANEFSRILDAQEARLGSNLAQSTTGNSAATASDSLTATADTVARTLPSGAPPELFLLSSPQGPVGVLFDQRGTYTTAPFTSNLAPQTFIDQFNQNRQLIAELSQQIAQSSQNLQHQLGGVQPTPTPTQQPAQAQPAQADHGLDQAAAQRVIDRIIQGQNQNQAQAGAPANADAPAENGRVINVAGHIWLIFKLACFVYIFAGGRGWYRPLILGSIAVIVYLAQLGMFEAQFNVMRRHFEALLPNAERIAQGRGQNPDQANTAQGAEARRNLTPEEAARRLLQQRRDGQFGWAREGMRTLERGVAIFLASLWPGVGERMVHAQEERERLERVAESEERERQEEERRRAEEAANAQSEEKNENDEAAQAPLLKRKDTESLGENFMEIGQSAKGKERAHDSVAEDAGGSGKGKEKAENIEDRAEVP